LVAGLWIGADIEIVQLKAGFDVIRTCGPSIAILRDESETDQRGNGDGGWKDD